MVTIVGYDYLIALIVPTTNLDIFVSTHSFRGLVFVQLVSFGMLLCENVHLR